VNFIVPGFESHQSNQEDERHLFILGRDPVFKVLDTDELFVKLLVTNVKLFLHCLHQLQELETLTSHIWLTIQRPAFVAKFETKHS